MVGVPRSQRLLSFHSTAAGLSGIFTCPAGMVVLVKSGYFRNNGSGPLEVHIGVQRADLAMLVYLYMAEPAAGEAADWQGWSVLNPGDRLFCEVTGAEVDGWVAGAVLNGPPPVPPVDTFSVFELSALPAGVGVAAPGLRL